MGFWRFAKCKLIECCDEPWIRDDVFRLRAPLEKHIYGQQIAVDVITSNLRSHIKSDPKKPLVMSFHGMYLIRIPLN